MNDYQSTTEMPETPALAPMSGVAVASFYLKSHSLLPRDNRPRNDPWGHWVSKNG